MLISRIFVPHALLALPPSNRYMQILVGHQCDAQTLFILAAIPTKNAKTFKSAVNKFQVVGLFEHQISGCVPVIDEFADDIQKRIKPFDNLDSMFIHIVVTLECRILVESLRKNDNNAAAAVRRSTVYDVFLFNPTDFTSRTLKVLLNAEIPSVEQPADKTSTTLREASSRHCKKCPEILQKIVCAKSAAGRQALPPSAINFFADDDELKKNFLVRCFTFVINACRSAVVVFAIALQTIVRMSGLLSFSVVASPYVNLANQTRTRFRQIEHLNSEKTNKDSIQHWNTVYAIVLDIVLGIAVTWVLVRFLSVETLFDTFMESAEIVVENLQNLLKWMMGSPAGFKLNLPLNYSLGTFFLFHIYLWQEYLGMIKPAFSVILQAALYTGVFGLSFQLSLLQDLLALSTFHIYCFYAYAAKLYNLHVSGLAAFWRLFRGKKWNPLRLRVDSCSYDTDQLFMGTLSLTILLFLMPTTALYYLVFTTLRLVVLTAQVSLYKMTTFISSAPIYMLLLYIFKSKQLISDVTVSIMPSKAMDDGPLIVIIKGTICSWEKAFFLFMDRIDTNESTTWRDFIGKLITGKVIYPI